MTDLGKWLLKKYHEYGSPLLILLAGTVLSIVLFIYLQHIEKQRMLEEFEDDAVERVYAIRDGIRMNVARLEAVRAFYSASREVERREFHEFVKPLLKDGGGMQALEWLPRVVGRDRRKFERDARSEGFPDFMITEKGRDGAVAPAGIRKDYYPVYFLEPYKDNERALGYDVASEETRRLALEQARDAGQAAATGPVRLIQERSDETGMLVFLPFYRNGAEPDTVETRRENLEGFVLAVFRIGDVVDKALAPWKKEREVVYVRIYDVTSPDQEPLLYDSSLSPSKMSRNDVGAAAYKTVLNVSGRKWLILCSPAPRFLAQEKQFHPFGFLIAGLVLSMMVTFHAFNAVRRRREISRHAREIGTSREALMQSEKRFRRLAENAQDIIYRYEFLPEKRFAYVSPAATVITGYTPEEHYADPGMGTKIVHPDDLSLLRQYLRDGNRQRQPVTLRWVRKDGTVIWIEQQIVPIFKDAGSLIAIEGIARDITERKRAAQALEKAAMEWTVAMDAYADAIYLLDLDRRLVRANRAFYSMLRIDPEASTGRHITEIMHPRGEETPCPVCRTQEKKQDQVIIVEAGDPYNPTGKPIEVTCRMIQNSEGQAQSILMSVHDLSRDRQVQEEKQKLEDQLRQAQKMETIGQLAGGVAHDFNNILSAIIGYAHLTLMKTSADDLVRHNIEQIIEASDRAAALTQGLLTFSRRQPMHLAHVEINGLLRRFEKFIRRLIREDIAFKTVCTDEALPVMADAGQIEQLIMNLVTNARDAMPQGGVLTVESRRVAIDDYFVQAHGYGEAGEYAVISVHDTGVGMDDLTKQRIFEPFFTTKEAGKGTGLGLASAYGIVKKHEGFINVYSEPSKGTMFKIYLPIVCARVEPDERKNIEASVKGGNETILVAEDDGALRKLTATILGRYGYTVIEAVDGEEAVRKFTKHRHGIRLVILDGIMPKMNGKEVYEEISALKPGVKAIFVSGYSGDVFSRDRIAGLEAVFIQKPMLPHDLLKKVREELDR